MQKAKTLAIYTVSHNWHMILFMCLFVCLSFKVFIWLLLSSFLNVVVVAAAFAFEVFVIFGKSVESDLWRPHTLLFVVLNFVCCSCWSGLVYNNYEMCRRWALPSTFSFSLSLSLSLTRALSFCLRYSNLRFCFLNNTIINTHASSVLYNI